MIAAGDPGCARDRSRQRYRFARRRGTVQLTLTLRALAVVPVRGVAIPPELVQTGRVVGEGLHELHQGVVGFFAAWEQPDLFAGEMRAAFRSLR